MTSTFDADHDLIPRGVTAIEASAGTGKTYAITHTVARMVAEDGVTIDRFLIVTYTRAAATELRTRTREALVERRHPEPTEPPPTEEEAERLDAAIAGFDAATITTIHGFCQLALGSLGVRVGRVGRESFDEADDSLTREVVRDHLLRRLATDPAALDRTAVGLGRTDDPSRIEDALLDVVGRHLGNQGSRLAYPPGPVEPAEPDRPDVHAAERLAARWGALAEEIVAEITARRQRAAVATFDSLVSDLAACLGDDDALAERAAAALRERFAVVLVDEFQDTDRLQWRIFDRGFVDPTLADPRTLVIVGDPKQAIYRFRGADIGTYVDAVRGEDGARVPQSLATNHRSDADLLAALNALFRGATFDEAGRIAYVPVTPRPKAPARSVTIAGAEPAPLEIRWTDPADRPETTQRTILTDVVATIHTHLTGTLRDPRTGTVRPITHGDLAILVKSNHDGDLIARFLTEHGIPAVRAGVGAVETSPAALQWRVLLHAMARPSDARRVRLAATGWFFGLGAAALTDDAVTTIQATIAMWSDLLATNGIHALWQRIRHTSAALTAIAACGDGDRGHTDLEHLVEVLHRGLDGRAAPAERVLTLLDDLHGDGHDTEERKRRIESDAAAVQITTIHSAKGLEYPIVLIPFGVKEPNDKNLDPFVYGFVGERWVDAAPRIDWSTVARDTDPPTRPDPDVRTAAGRRAIAAREVIEEDGRLVYVALTRARHRLVLWVKHGKRSNRGAAGRLLWGDRAPDGTLLPERAKQDPDGENPTLPTSVEDARGRYDRLVALPMDGRGPHIAHHLVEAAAVGQAGTGRAAPEIGGSARTVPADRALEREGWRAWSYSGLTSEGTAISNYGSERLRDDEPDDPEADDPAAPAAPNPWTALSAGTGFGDAVHRILEDADFAALLPGRPDAVAALTTVVERHGFRLAPSDDRSLLAARLVDTVRTPLGAAFADRCPAEVLERGSLRELEFSFDLGADEGAAALGAIAGLAEHLDPDDPFREYFSRIGPGMLATDDASGYLSGSIDLVVRDPGTDGVERCWVVDYKTNREPGGHYDLAAVLGLMEHGNYPLQAAIYLVALRRYLQTRLGAAYDDAAHLGGASYWFVRGMVGPDTAGTDGTRGGVCTWRPAPEFIRALDALLGGRP